MKIIFFIESLHAGGAERRVVELLSYLNEKPKYEIMVVLMRKEIHYTKFKELNIPYTIIERKWIKKDPRIIFKFYNICKKFNPDIIHSWGYMASFYSLFTHALMKVPVINNQITRSLPKVDKWSMFHLISAINFKFSKVILSNSKAGLESHGISNTRGKVIYNGINLNRFNNLHENNNVKLKYGITTKYLIIMVASFTVNKDYKLFLEIAKIIDLKRGDVTFLGVGGGQYLEQMQKKVISEKISNVVFTGEINDVESLINIADIGVLFSNKEVHGEGISNSITEYMALSKPVIANDAGGTKEIVENEINGYLIKDESPEEIAEIISNLLDNADKRNLMGLAGKKLIHKSFTIERMGKEFEELYEDISSCP